MSTASDRDLEVPPTAAAAFARFGDRLDEAQRALAVATARQLETAAQDLRRWELANGDEPDSAFSAAEGRDS